ncbi:MAG: endo-1,4-beta-xylanase [Candidatus Saccharimonadales bacterium]
MVVKKQASKQKTNKRWLAADPKSVLILNDFNNEALNETSDAMYEYTKSVKVYVTEFDVNMDNLQADANTKNQVEANIYYEMMRACIESKVCPSFSILGITDKETWYNHIGLKDPRPLPFDEKYRPKPAYWALRNALEQP